MRDRDEDDRGDRTPRRPKECPMCGTKRNMAPSAAPYCSSLCKDRYGVYIQHYEATPYRRNR